MADLEERLDYTHLGEPPRDRRVLRRILIASPPLLGAVALLLTLSSATLPLSSSLFPVDLLKATLPVPHTGEWCMGSGAQTYTKTTLKRIIDRTVSALLVFDAHEPKFEASDVIRVAHEEVFYVVCDSSWGILRLDERLPLLSPSNTIIKPSPDFVSPDDDDSGFEAIIHDPTSGTDQDYYVIRESVAHRHENTQLLRYTAQILKIHLSSKSYDVAELCPSEMSFECVVRSA